MGRINGLHTAKWGAAAGISLMLIALPTLASCSTPSAQPDPPTTTNTPPCLPAPANTPTEISRLTLDGVTADTFTTTLTVPYAGLDSGPLDRPSFVRAGVITAESGVPVTFRAQSGTIIESPNDDWLDGGNELTVESTSTDMGCIAQVYVLSTQVGTMTLTATSQNTLSTTVEVVNSTAAARDLSVTTDTTEVTSGGSVSVTVTASDAFGNRVAGSTVVISVPLNAPARYTNGTNRATVLTNDEGQARVTLLTESNRTRTFNIRVRGVNPRCAGVNQYRCGTNEPFPGAQAAIGDVRVPIRVLAPPMADDITAAQISPRSERR